MPVHHNLALIHRMYEALNAQDLDAHDKYWTHDMIWHGPPGWGEIHGVDAFKYELLAPFYRAFPDYHAKNDVELADGDWVAATGYLTCTHQGEWLGLPATGRLVHMRFSDFWLVRDGLLAENFVMVDLVDVMKQLGTDLLGSIGR